MSDQLKESLSAVIDGEADEFEMRRVLDEVSNDPALRGVWERYHLVGSVMRGERNGTANSLGDRFWSRIDAGEGDVADDIVESTPAAQSRKPRWTQWGQRVAGVAVAAGVAAAVIVGFREDQPPSVDAPKVAVVEAASVPPASMALFDDETRGQAVPAALDVQRAHAYMLHHARHVALNNRSVVPFVKVAAFETK
jgi:sigma-E factor negative regulatory protein RseA